MARCREFCITERVKCRELFLNNILYVDSALDLVQLTSSLLLPGKQACRGAFGRQERRGPCLRGHLGASWEPLVHLLAPLGAPERQREALVRAPAGPLVVRARRGEFYRLCRRPFGSPLRRLNRRGPMAKSNFMILLHALRFYVIFDFAHGPVCLNASL